MESGNEKGRLGFPNIYLSNPGAIRLRYSVERAFCLMRNPVWVVLCDYLFAALCGVQSPRPTWTSIPSLVLRAGVWCTPTRPTRIILFISLYISLDRYNGVFELLDYVPEKASIVWFSVYTASPTVRIYNNLETYSSCFGIVYGIWRRTDETRLINVLANLPEIGLD